MAQKRKRVHSSKLVRIANKAIRIAERNKKKTGTSIGKFVEDAIYAYNNSLHEPSSIMTNHLNDTL